MPREVFPAVLHPSYSLYIGDVSQSPTLEFFRRISLFDAVAQRRLESTWPLPPHPPAD